MHRANNTVRRAQCPSAPGDRRVPVLGHNRRVSVLGRDLGTRPLVLVVVLLLVTMCRRWDNPYDPRNNRPPNVPARPWPASGDSAVDSVRVLTQGLSWAGGDTNPWDRVVYRLYLGTTPTPALAESSLRDTVYRPQYVRALTRYWWRVVAIDSLGDSAIGPVWNFKTITVTPNHQPYTPRDPTPDSASTDQWLRVTLTWTGGDPDPADSVFYKVYLGTTTPPPLVASGLRQPSYLAGRLKYDNSYYWRVVATDNRGDSTVGPLWWFRTIPAVLVTQPNATSWWRMGSTQTVLWTGGPTPTQTDSTVILYSSNGGITWLRQGRAQQQGRFDWLVPGPASTNSQVRVRAHVGGDTALGKSATFQVTDTNAPSPITVDSPPAGARWVIGSTHHVTWTGGTWGVDSTVIFYRSTSGGSWQRQGKAVEQGSYLWTVPGPATTDASVRVTAYCLNKSTEGVSGRFEVTELAYPDSVIALVRVGSRPKALLWDSLSNTVFVANYSDSSVSVIDGGTSQVIATVRVGNYPTALCWNATNNRVYVANYSDSSLSVIDGTTNQVLTTVVVGANPYALCWNRTNNKVYVAHKPGTTVTIVDGANNSVITTVPVDTNPCALVYNQGVNKVYVANWANNTVTVIDGASNLVLATVPVHINPCALTVDGQSNVMVANQFSGNATIIDGNTNSEITTVETGSKPWAVAHNATSTRLYAANSEDATVTIISAQSYNVEGTIPVGTRPRSIIWADWVNKLYVGNYDGGSITILDGANNMVVKHLPVGAKPTALCANRIDNKVYVANYDDGTVSVIGP